MLDRARETRSGRQVAQHLTDLANQIAAFKTQLGLKRAHLRRLLSQQAAILSELNHQQQDRNAAIEKDRQTLAGLDRTRTQIVTLVVKLRKQLKAEEIAAIGSSFQGGAHVTYGAWARVFLQTMGISSCHANKVAVVSWQVAEFTQAAWNPLATTHAMPGSTDFNGSGVQNYLSLTQGLEATKLTLEGGLTAHGYGRIVSSLSGCADPMTTAGAINASDWCRGCAGGSYVIGMVPKVEANYATYAAL